MDEIKLFTEDTVVIPDDSAPTATDPARQHLVVRSYGMTDLGRVRKSNEDQFLIAVLCKALQIQQTSIPQPSVHHGKDRSYIFLVADGMGGHAGGEEASRLAVESLETFLLETFRWFGQCRGQEADTVLADFQRALAQANAQILTEAAQRSELRGMGTTLTLAYCVDRELYVAHAGDSRCYLCRDGRLYRLTRDHTLVEELVHQGGLTPEEGARHPWRHCITNAVGGSSPEIEVEVHQLQLESGDRMLLCSDGLTEKVPESVIAHVLDHKRVPEEACQCLVGYANKAGGDDNITAVVAHFLLSP